MNPALDNNLNPDTLLRCCIYARVSTSEQAEKDLSIPAQTRECQAHAARQGWLVTHTFEDPGYSGTSEDRPGLQAMLSAADARAFDVLLIHKSDRLSRDEFFALAVKVRLKKLGLRMASVTEAYFGGEHPMDAMMEGMARLTNAFYIANLRQEIKKGQLEAVRQGRGVGVHPFGYAPSNPDVQGSAWIVREDEAAIVRRLFQRVLDGYTLSQIARELNALGIGTARSRARGRKSPAKETMGWATPTLRLMLRNRAYVGQVQLAGVWYDGVHAPLVDTATFDTVSTILDKRGGRRTEATETGLFVGGLLRCPLCGANMTYMCESAGSGLTRPLNLQNGQRVSKYACVAYRRRLSYINQGCVPGTGCPGFNIRQSRVLRILRASLTANDGPVPPSFMPPSLALLPSRIDSPALVDRGSIIDRGRLLAELAKISRMRAGYQAQHAEELMTTSELRVALAALAEKQSALQAELDVADVPAPPPVLTPARRKEVLALLNDENLTLRQKRDRLRLLVSYIVVAPDKAGVMIVPA